MEYGCFPAAALPKRSAQYDDGWLQCRGSAKFSFPQLIRSMSLEPNYSWNRNNRHLPRICPAGCPDLSWNPTDWHA